jgi:acyl carrier protein
VIVSDEAAPDIRTVGQLHAYILDRRHQTQQQGCPTGRVFRDIRQVLTAAAAVPRQAVRPSTGLAAILPPPIRRRAWKTLQQKVSGRLPGLRLPFRLGPILAGGCLTAGVVGVAMMVPHVGLRHAGVLSGVVTVIVLYVVFLATRPWAVALPGGLVTVGDVTLAAVPPGYEAVATQQMTDADVWEKLQKIVADILGVKIESVVPSARFVEDLGAG